MDIERVRHLLACLGEECGEVQQIVGKSLRFGIFDHHPKTDGVMNLELLRREILDIWAVSEMLEEALDADGAEFSIVEHVQNKKDKVERYMRREEVWETQPPEIKRN